MDKYEFKLKVDEMKALVNARNYKAAAEIAETINWRKVRNLNALVLAGEVFEQVERYEDSKDILLMAYDKSPIGRNIIYRLAEIAIKTKNFVDAKEYYNEFVDIAPHDNLKFVLKYKMTAAQGLPFQEQIRILEELKEQEYSEEWAYELAYLYHRDGQPDKCVEACDELILWFGDGIYVEKALELKMHYQPLTRPQEEKYRLFKQKRAGVIEVKPEDFLESGEIVNEAVQIPSVVTSPEKYNTANLQNEIARGMKQIINTPEKEQPPDAMKQLRKLADEGPYLSYPEDAADEPDETDRGPVQETAVRPEQSVPVLGNTIRPDRNASVPGNAARQERNGPVSENTVHPEQSMSVSGKTGHPESGSFQDPRLYQPDEKRQPVPEVPEKKLTIKEIQAEWEKTKQAMQDVLNEAGEQKSESVREKALYQAESLVERLNEMIPQLITGMTLREQTGQSPGVQEHIDEAGRIVAGMNQLLQEQIDYLMAGRTAGIHKVSDPTRELPHIPPEMLMDEKVFSDTVAAEEAFDFQKLEERLAKVADASPYQNVSEKQPENQTAWENSTEKESEWRFMKEPKGKTDMETGQKSMKKPEDNINRDVRRSAVEQLQTETKRKALGEPPVKPQHQTAKAAEQPGMKQSAMQQSGQGIQPGGQMRQQAKSRSEAEMDALHQAVLNSTPAAETVRQPVQKQQQTQKQQSGAERTNTGTVRSRSEAEMDALQQAVLNAAIPGNDQSVISKQPGRKIRTGTETDQQSAREMPRKRTDIPHPQETRIQTGTDHGQHPGMKAGNQADPGQDTNQKLEKEPVHSGKVKSLSEAEMDAMRQAVLAGTMTEREPLRQHTGETAAEAAVKKPLVQQSFVQQPAVQNASIQNALIQKTQNSSDEAHAVNTVTESSPSKGTLRGTRINAKKIRISLSAKPDFKTQEQIQSRVKPEAAAQTVEPQIISQQYNQPETVQNHIQQPQGSGQIYHQPETPGAQIYSGREYDPSANLQNKVKQPSMEQTSIQQSAIHQPSMEQPAIQQSSAESSIKTSIETLSDPDNIQSAAGAVQGGNVPFSGQEVIRPAAQPVRDFHGTAGIAEQPDEIPVSDPGYVRKQAEVKQTGETQTVVRNSVAAAVTDQSLEVPLPEQEFIRNTPVTEELKHYQKAELPEETEEFSEEDLAAAALEAGFYQDTPQLRNQPVPETELYQEIPQPQIRKPAAAGEAYQGAAQPENQTAELDDSLLKKLTPEQREVFSYFVPISGMEAQIYDLLQGVSRHLKWDKHALSGNIIIEGISGSGKTVLIMDIIKVLQKECQRPNGKIGKIDANALNQKDIDVLMEKISGGCLIIESAGKISRETAVRLSLHMEREHSGTLFILEDTKEGIQKALERDSTFASRFTEKISIPVFTTDDLVLFGKAYANDLDYDIDEMGILALYKRVNNIQKLDRATTLTEVKEIVDEAIDRAESGALKKVFGILTATRYNDDNLVILREKDFEE